MHLSLHLAWLEGAFERAGCPACTLRLGHERDWLEVFMYDHSGDPGITRMLSEARGFCHDHAWMIARNEELRGPVALALTYEPLVRHLLVPSRRAGRSRVQGAARGRQHELWTPGPGRGCPACVALARTDEIYTRVFARSLASHGFLALYARSEGLCLAHLSQVFAVSLAPARVRLLPVHAARLEAAMKGSALGAHAGSLSEPWLRLGLSLLVGADPHPAGASDALPLPAIGWCRVCVMEREAEAQSVARAAGDPGALPAGAWLCARHAWQAFRLVAANRSGGGLEAWLRGGLEAALAECVARAARLAGPDAGRPEDRQLALDDGPLLAVRSCVVCSTVEAVVREQIGATSDALPVGEVCLRHLALYRPATEAARERHGRAVVARLQELAADLDEFIRKSSWECRHEPKGQEQDSWRRAISLFVGDE